MKDYPAGLGYLRQGIAELDEYLYSPEVFWQLSGRRRRRRDDLPLTIGNLLFSVKLLRQREENHADEEVENLISRLQAKREDRKSAWIIKTVAEFRKRLTSWKGNLEEHLSGVGQAAYPVIVRDRVLLTLLTSELAAEHTTLITLRGKIPDVEKLTGQLELLDVRLKANASAGRFVWDVELETIFPPQPYWYLYLDFKQ